MCIAIKCFAIFLHGATKIKSQLSPKKAWPGSRDLFLKFGTPSLNWKGRSYTFRRHEGTLQQDVDVSPSHIAKTLIAYLRRENLSFTEPDVPLTSPWIAPFARFTVCTVKYLNFLLLQILC